MQAPNTPSIINTLARLEPAFAVRRDKAIKASTPPSPLLSARITNSTYFSETTMVIAQNSIEIIPSTAAGVNGMPCSALKHSFNAYSGLVPISPNTMPNAASVMMCRRDDLNPGLLLVCVLLMFSLLLVRASLAYMAHLLQFDNCLNLLPHCTRRRILLLNPRPELIGNVIAVAKIHRCAPQFVPIHE